MPRENREVSQKTLALAHAIKVKAEEEGVYLGNPINNENSGDAIWFLLRSDNSDETYGILMVSPYCVLTHMKVDGDLHISAITSPIPFFAWMKSMGIRGFTNGEMESLF